MKRTISFILLLSLFSCLNNTGKNSNKEGDYEAIADSLTSDLNSLWENGPIVGFSVAIVDEFETIYEQGFGYSNAETKEGFSEHTLQNIASISKTFIGISLLKAQELGKLHLDDPVNQYIPFEVRNPYYPDDVITIRHLATHTSSISDSEENYNQKSYILKDTVPTDLPQHHEVGVTFNQPAAMMPMIRYLEKVLMEEGEWYSPSSFLEKHAGDVYHYSNIGATLAAVILEFATGEPFNLFTKKHILQPLNMRESGWFFETVDLAKHTTLYMAGEEEIPLYSLITYPDGGLITSSHDLGKYLTELIKGYSGKGTILSNASYRELFNPQLNQSHFPGPGEFLDFNEGIFMSLLPNGFIGHSGGDPGVSTFMYLKAGSLTGRILLINTELDSIGNNQYNSIINRLGQYEKKLIDSKAHIRE